MDQAQNNQRGFHITPLWVATIVFCALATYVVISRTNEVAEVKVGEAGIKFHPGAIASADPEKLKELAESVKQGGAAPPIQPSQAPSSHQLEQLEQIDPAPAFTGQPLQEIAGRWTDGKGAFYDIAPAGDGVFTFSETSTVYGVPMQTAVGQGRRNGDRFEFAFNSILGVPGVGVLQSGGTNALTGTASFPMAGTQVALQLTR